MTNKNLLSIFSTLVLFIPMTSSAKMLSVGDPQTGSFSIGGNAELNINFRDHDSPTADVNGEVEKQNEIDQDGRLLVEFAGKRVLDNSYYANFVAQALFNTSGNATVDDAYLEFGKERDWSIKTGRFEAFDMFPDPMDVFVEYSGDTSNSLYQNNASYSYQLAEARGRASEGQILINKYYRNLYLEVNLLLGNRANLFSQNTYHDFSLYDTDSITISKKQKDTVIARPVISYQLNDFNFAIAAEKNLVSDAIVGSNGTKEIDLLDRDGYAGKISWDNGKYAVHAMYAFLDAPYERNQSIGITGEYKNVFALGLIHSFNEYKNPNWREGDIDLSTLYASYAFRNVLDIENFSVLLGGYLSELNDDLTTKDQEPFAESGDAGGRIRLHYVF